MAEMEEFLDWKWGLYDAIWIIGEIKELNSELEPIPDELMIQARSFRKELEIHEVKTDFVNGIRNEIVNDITDQMNTAQMISDEI